MENESKPTYFFIIAVVCDLVSMNIWRYFPESTGERVYFIGQSATMLLYIWTISVVSKHYKIVNMISSAWLPFAFNDLFETIMKENNVIGYGEIICGIVSFTILLYKSRLNIFLWLSK